MIEDGGTEPPNDTEAEMSIVRWNPWSELDALHREMDRSLRREFAPSGSSFLPATDVVETDAGYELALDLPGVKLEDLRIELRDGVLEIAGQRVRDGAPRAEGFTRTERRFGSFSRSFRLGKGVDEAGIRARMDGGVLTVSLPKREEAQPRRIEIEA